MVTSSRASMRHQRWLIVTTTMMTMTMMTMIVTLPCCYGGITPELYWTAKSDGGFSSALEPTIKVSTKGTVWNDWCDYSGGVTVRAASTTNEQQQQQQILPFSLWGTVQKKSFLGWDWKARLDTESSNLNDVDFDIQAVGGPTNLLLRASGYWSGAVTQKTITGQVQSVAFTQGIRLPWMGGQQQLSVSPAYNLQSKRTKVGVMYDVSSGTQIALDVNRDQQKLTIAHAINDSNTVVPSITSNGHFALDYHYAVHEGGVLTTKYRPNDAAILEYQDGPWIASATIPIDGYYKPYLKPKLVVRRSLTVE